MRAPKDRNLILLFLAIKFLKVISVVFSEIQNTYKSIFSCFVF